MDIQTRKIEFVQAFLKLQNEEIVSRFEKMLSRTGQNADSKKLPDTLRPFELAARIDESEKDFEEGRYKGTEEILSKY